MPIKKHPKLDDNGVPLEDDKAQKELTIVMANSNTIVKHHRVARFRGRPMIMLEAPYPHFEPLHRERFNEMAYPVLGGITRSRMSDVFAYLASTAEDLTPSDHLILFGLEDAHHENAYRFYDPHATTTLWDMQELEWLTGDPGDPAVWRSPYGRIVVQDSGHVPFVMSLAGGNPDKYDDIMQSLAPLVMSRKPDGVIWWVGDGANGKSTLMDAIYKIFPGQLSSITVKRLTDGRDTPSLNGTLANVVKESSEGRIEDTEVYKSVGTHEDFRVHKFHSQDDVMIRGNLHHIFSANNIPAFNDKGYSARRRTFIVPFTQRFKSDPTFEERTFTPEMFGQLIFEMCRYAKRLRDQGYRYKWSSQTLAAKVEYDSEANSAEEYARELVRRGVVAFDGFNSVKVDYDNWCGDNGYVPLGMGNMRRAMQSIGFERLSRRDGDDDELVTKQYRLPHINTSDLIPFGLLYRGMYTVAGFQLTKEPDVPEFEEPHPPVAPEPPKKTVVGDKW